MGSLMDFLLWVLPTGFLSSLATWMVSRRKRNNDMLSQLQASINMLSTENRKILDENIKLRSKNAELVINQQEMKAQLVGLTKEIERLRMSLNRKQIKDEKQNKVVDATASSANRNTNRVRHSKTDAQEPTDSNGAQNCVRHIDSSAGYSYSDDSGASSPAQGELDGGEGDDTNLRGESGDTPAEPP